MSNFLSRARRRLDHRWTSRRVSAYLDGELVSRSRARIESHVGECPECARLLRGMRRMLELLSGWPRTATPSRAPEIAFAVRARLRGAREH
jgi:anti-sigma factor RsiW